MYPPGLCRVLSKRHESDGKVPTDIVRELGGNPT
jgi:hypothetical protein